MFNLYWCACVDTQLLGEVPTHMDMFLSPQTIVESGRGYYKLYQNIIRVRDARLQY